MPGLDVNVIDIPSRSLAAAPLMQDGYPRSGQRSGRYGEQYGLSLIPSKHVLADEGSYFTANNLQTALTGQTTTSYDATKPSLLVYNSNPASSGRRIYIDYISLLNGGTAYSNATSNTVILCSVATDNVNRYSSGGTALTVQNVNQDESRSSGALVYAGAIVTAAASALRTITAQRLFRLPVSATALTLANADSWLLPFGGIDPCFSPPNAASATLEANAIARVIPMPAVSIGPGQSFLFNINCVAGGAVTAGNLHYCVGFWDR